MKKTIYVLVTLLMAAMLLLAGCGRGSDAGTGGDAAASGSSDVNSVLTELCQYVADNVETFDVEGDSGAWFVFGLKTAGSDAVEEDRFTAYHDAVRGFVKSHKGVLSEDRYTQYERTSMALKALGVDPTNVEGYDLMAPVDDYDAVCEQGINAEIYAILSSHYVGYELKNEEKYKADILAAQTEDGGISFDGKRADVDITAMAIQALALYDDEETQDVIAEAREYLSSQQGADGSYGNCESTAQVIMAIGMLKEDPAKAEDFIKDGKTLLDGLMLYRTGGAFCHLAGDDVNMLATQQAMIALEAAIAGQNGEQIF